MIPTSRPRCPTADQCRAQSETIGTILLIGVVVVAIGTFGAFFLSDFADESAPLVSITVDGNESTANVSHAGGTTVPAGELSVTVSQGSTTERYVLDEDDPNSDFVKGSDPSQFAPGDRWEFDVSDQPLVADERITVRLIHVPSNEVVDSERYTFAD